MKQEELIETKRLRKVLEDLYGGSITEMAKAIGIDRSTLSRYKTGELAPSTKTLLAISKAAKIKLEWLQGQGADEIEFVPPEDLGDSTARPVLTIPSATAPTQETPGYQGLRRETAPYHCKRDRYWLLSGKELPKLAILKRDYLLVRVCEPREVSPCEVGTLCLVKRSDEVAVDLLGEKDKKNSNVKLCGHVVMVERDMVGVL